MKFIIARSKFLEGLRAVHNIVAGKGTLPILNNVMINATGHELTMTTTDLDISITCAVACDGCLDAAGEAAREPRLKGGRRRDRG